jgi:hypothetical protein
VRDARPLIPRETQAREPRTHEPGRIDEMRPALSRFGIVVTGWLRVRGGR